MRRQLVDCATLVGLKLATCGLVLALGFHAVSDDDFARVVIAQRWVAAPALDPSGTSWLPFPFWLNGLAMLALGGSFGVARGVALVTAVASALLVYVAARWLEVERRGALLGAAIACCIPYACWLGVATVPDGLNAALVLFAAVAARRDGVRDRALGAAALLAATLSRYEAWPVAAAFCALTLWDGWRNRSWTFAAIAALAVAGPVVWMANGFVRHADPLFFVVRVNAYRAALGGTPASLASALASYPLALLRREPELATLTLVATTAALAARQPVALTRYARPGLALAALLAFLVAGEIRNAAPTHHAERAMLAIWLAAAVLVGDLSARTWPAIDRQWRATAAVVTAVLLGVAAGWFRPRFANLDSFVDRRAELSIGAACRQRATPAERLAIDTPDYGFFAVMAGFQHPERAVALDDRDPRHPRPVDPFADPRSLVRQLSREDATWLVASGDHRSVAAQVGRVEVERGDLALLRVTVQ